MSAYLHLAERVFRCGVLLGIISSPSTKRSTRMVLSRAKMLSVDFNLQTRRKGRKSPCYCAEDRHGQSPRNAQSYRDTSLGSTGHWSNIGKNRRCLGWRGRYLGRLHLRPVEDGVEVGRATRKVVAQVLKPRLRRLGVEHPLPTQDVLVIVQRPLAVEALHSSATGTSGPTASKSTVSVSTSFGGHPKDGCGGTRASLWQSM